MLLTSLHSLKSIRILKLDLESVINETLSITQEFRNQNRKELPEKDNISKQLARKILNNIPQVYGFDFYSPIAKRWCTQFNENSKIICRYDEVSECNHNDIVGWSMDPEVSKKFINILFRDADTETIYISKRLDFMKKLFESVSADTIELQVKGKKRLAKMMYAMYYGDYVSCYLAILRKIDPTPVLIINELKNELAKI